MQPIWNRAQFKQTGKDTFLSNYWPFVGVCVLLALLSGDLFSLQLQQTSRELVSNSILIYDDPSLGNAVAYGAQLLSPYLAPFVAGSLLLSLLVVFPLQVGASRFFLESRPGYKAPFQRIGHGFVENYGNVFLTGLFKWLFTLLWSLLFLIPGIIRSFGYFAVPYILAENPNLDHSRALQLSLQMTRGYKWDLFVLNLSFLGWFLLSGISFNIAGIFYVNPYYQATLAEAYRFLRENAMANGYTNSSELPGTQPPLWSGGTGVGL